MVAWFMQTIGIVMAGSFFMVRDNESIFKLSQTAKEAAEREGEKEAVS